MTLPTDPTVHSAVTGTPPYTLAARKLEYRRLKDLPADPRNPKAHDLGSIRASLERFGFLEPVVLDGRTGYLISGHGRVQALLAMEEDAQAASADAVLAAPEGVVVDEGGRWTVPVASGWASADDYEARAALIALNRTSELGGWVDDALLELLGELDDEPMGHGLTGVGFSEADLDALAAALAEAGDGIDLDGLAAPDAAPDHGYGDGTPTDDAEDLEDDAPQTLEEAQKRAKGANASARVKPEATIKLTLTSLAQRWKGFREDYASDDAALVALFEAADKGNV